MARVVRCFGGVAHGRTMQVLQPRFCVPIPPPTLRFHYGGVAFEPLRHHSYYVDTFHERASRPTRHRELRVAIIEGADLLPNEHRELEQLMWETRWHVDPGHFFHDFEQWWSEVLYRHTGRLEWENARVD